MLVDAPEAERSHILLDLVALQLAQPKRAAKRVQAGIYEISHFGGSFYMEGWDHFPDFGQRAPYGVCDNLEQVFDLYPELNASSREFVVTLHLLLKSEQPEEGGWRWHKWGKYIGLQNPQREYLHDEPEIDKVYTYHIYEKQAQGKGKTEDAAY